MKYKDVFTPSRGIFTGVLLPIGYTQEELNIIMYGLIADRELSNIVSNFVRYENGNYIISDNDLLSLADVIIMYYSDKWEKLYTILRVEYNPIDNYKRVEHELIEGEMGEEIRTNENTVNKVYGFDSNNPTNDKTEDNTHQNNTTGTNTKERNLTVSGKMGGTSTQSLIREELKIRKENNLIKTILDDVKSFSTLSIY